MRPFACWLFALAAILCVFSTGAKPYWQSRLQVSVGAGGSVAVQACGTEGQSGGSAVATFDYTGLTTTAAASAIAVPIVLDTKTVTGVGAIWDPAGANQAMTSVQSATNAGPGLAAIFGLVSPSSFGNKTIRVSWTTNSHVFVVACSYTGVNSTFGTAFTGFTGGVVSGTTNSVTVTSAVNHATIATFVGQNGSITAVSGNELYRDNATGLIVAAAANRDVGAASVVMTATTSASGTAPAVGADISF